MGVCKTYNVNVRKPSVLRVENQWHTVQGACVGRMWLGRLAQKPDQAANKQSEHHIASTDDGMMASRRSKESES